MQSNSDVTLQEAIKIASKLEALYRLFFGSRDPATQEVQEKGILDSLKELSDSLSPEQISIGSLAVKKQIEQVAGNITRSLEENNEIIEEIYARNKAEYIQELKEIGEITLSEWLEPATKDFEQKYIEVFNRLEAWSKEQIKPEDPQKNIYWVFLMAALGGFIGSVVVGLVLCN